MPKRVLVTGSRSLAALEIAREFKRIGYQVHVADSMGGLAARLSRFVDHTHTYPSPALQFQAFSSAMTDLVQKHGFDMVVPTCEEIFHLARLGPNHKVAPILFAPQLSVLKALHDKAEFVKTCISLGIAVPETRHIHDNNSLENFTDDPKSWVFKPCFSRFGTDTLLSPSVSSLRQIKPTPNRPWLAQRRILGQEICFHAVAREGIITAFVAYSGSWRLEKGASIAFTEISQPLTDQARAYAKTLAANFSFTGQFACDGIIDDQNLLWLIECNPRATSGVHLLSGDGSLAHAILGSQEKDLSEPLLKRHHHILPAMLTLGLAQAISSRRLKHWWRVLTMGKDVAGLAGDRLPFLGAILDGLSFIWLGLRQARTLTAATTYDIEWNGES
jgi:hypothetical protein